MARTLVTQSDVDHFMDLRRAGKTNREIAEITGWSYGAVQDYTGGRRAVPTFQLHDPEKYKGVYQAPPAVRTDERKHLKAVIAVGGFTWKRGRAG